MNDYVLTGAQKRRRKIEKPSFGELLTEAQMSEEEKLSRKIDDNVLPAIIQELSHRMYDFTNRQHDSAMELFKLVANAVGDWFEKTGFFLDGYRLAMGKPNHHGIVNMSIRLGVGTVKRTVNLKSYIPSERFFQSTGEIAS